MTAQPGEIRIGAGAERLLDTRIEPLKPAPELTELARFGEGQISGPAGPQFAGNAPTAGTLLLRDAVFGAAIGTTLFVLMMGAHWIGIW